MFLYCRISVVFSLSKYYVLVSRNTVSIYHIFSRQRLKRFTFHSNKVIIFFLLVLLSFRETCCLIHLKIKRDMKNEIFTLKYYSYPTHISYWKKTYPIISFIMSLFQFLKVYYFYLKLNYPTQYYLGNMFSINANEITLSNYT